MKDHEGGALAGHAEGGFYARGLMTLSLTVIGWLYRIACAIALLLGSRLVIGYTLRSGVHS